MQTYNKILHTICTI